MANSKKSLKNKLKIRGTGSNGHSVDACFLREQLLGFLVNLQDTFPLNLLVAYSGGLDSTVLLHLLVEAKKTFLFELHAMHVHHGLSKNADLWADFCQSQCASLKVPIQIVHVTIDLKAGNGIEAAARALRYNALFEARFGDIKPLIVTAHHQDDQAETFILQLLRGAGVKGLSSMAAVDQTKRMLRPLLNISRAQLVEYATCHQLEWCEDESNQNTNYERNFVRQSVMPLLEARYPAVKSVISRSASHMAEARTLLDDLAQLDAEPLLQDNHLDIKGLRNLSKIRAKNCLRWWLAQNSLPMPNTEHLNEILLQLLDAKPDANLTIKLQHLTLKRFQHRAYLVQEKKLTSYDLVWNGEAEIVLPDGGKLQFKQVKGAGLANKLGMTKLRITNRDGGERFKPSAIRPTRTLKYLFQTANIPPWQRRLIPLIYWQDTLAYVPNIGVAYDLQAGENEPGVEITWIAPTD